MNEWVNGEILEALPKWAFLVGDPMHPSFLRLPNFVFFCSMYITAKDQNSRMLIVSAECWHILKKTEYLFILLLYIQTIADRCRQIRCSELKRQVLTNVDQVWGFWGKVVWQHCSQTLQHWCVYQCYANFAGACNVSLMFYFFIRHPNFYSKATTVNCDYFSFCFFEKLRAVCVRHNSLFICGVT